MTDIYIPKNYPPFAMADEISMLFDPITSCTDIDYAGYGKIYADGGHFYMDNLVELQDYLLVQLKGDTIFDYQLLHTISKDSHFRNKHSKIIVLEQDIDSKNYWKKTSNMFNIESLLYVFEKFDGYFDVYAFASKVGKNINSFYISHFDVLEKFMFYFKEKNKDIINLSENNKIILPERNRLFYYIKRDLEGHGFIQEEKKPINLHELYNLDKYPLNIKGKIIYITSRELDCWKLLSNGYSYKNIAEKLGLSKKTIETHLINIKNKLQTTSKDKLSKIFHDSSLADF